MRVLVAYGTKMKGTAGIAEAIGNDLRGHRLDVTVLDAADVTDLDYDAALVGSAIYALRWRAEAVRLLKRLARSGTRIPVWLFHSGPVGDDEASEPQELPRKVAKLAERLDVRDVATFGGRIPASGGGPIAAAMARDGKAGDWRDFESIAEWADGIADALGATAR